MEISFTGTVMTVQMIGAFFAKYGTGSGDLYLSSKGYQVSGMGPHHIGDYFKKDEGWDYVVSAAAPNGVYTLSFPSIIETTSGRVAQAFQEGYGIKVPDVTVASSLIGDTYTLMFDTANLNLGPTFGVHFTMSCGNDVIEGEVPMVPAPEPSTVCLFVSGFVGFVIKMRKKLF